tara:strand:- start:185 stop:718 length:534 start_codon:yes stop_codon:yes gene_type:complete
VSRIGNKPVEIPSGVDLTIDGVSVSVKGPRGVLSRDFRAVSFEQEESRVIVKPTTDDGKGRAFHGLARALLNNMVVGVSEGFKKNLTIIGTGYRAAASGNTLTLNVGYSHPVEMKVPEGISAKVDKNTLISLESNDKQALGEFAAQVRRVRPPEPYKGKGIRYEDEYVRIKVGKTAG